MFFAATLTVSSAGPGNIAASALMVPLAMSAAVAAYNYLNNVIVHTTVAIGGFLVLGGLRLFRSLPAEGPVPAALDVDAASGPVPPQVEPFEPRHIFTALVIGALIVSVVVGGVNVGMAAFAGAVLLTVFKASDERRAIARMPWNVILMISGVSLLIAMLEKTGGTDLAASLLARASTPSTITAIAAFVSGTISIFSSTSGVVLPALIPLVPGLVERVGGGTLLGVAAAINVNGHLVDVSPLSTLGALCLASAPPATDTRRLFNALLAWGVSMTVVGALVCWLLFGVLGLP